MSATSSAKTAFVRTDVRGTVRERSHRCATVRAAASSISSTSASVLG